MHSYCDGFLFSEDGFHVLLIRKNRPKWQAGKLNGVGGHIEEGETPHEAMVREFEEEAGLKIEKWDELAVLEFNGGEVHFFCAFSDEMYKFESKTDELVEVYPVDNILADPAELFKTIDHLPLMITLALNEKVTLPVTFVDKGKTNGAPNS